MEISVSDIAKVTGGQYIGDEAALRRIVTGLDLGLAYHNARQRLPRHARSARRRQRFRP